jgi:hypothetical protein
VAQIHIIFKLPDRLIAILFGLDIESPGPLVYVEWFTKLHMKGQDHQLYLVAHRKKDGEQETGIIHLDQIMQQCQLYPKFRPKLDHQWKSHSVLEQCDSFFLNPFADLLFYQSII